MLNQLSYNIWEKEIAWISVIVIAFITGIIMFQRAYTKTESGTHFNPIFRAYGLFALGWMGSRIFFIFSDFEKLNNGETAIYVLFVLASYIVGIFSAISIIILFERHILEMKTKIMSKLFLTFTFALVIGFVFIVIFPSVATIIITPFRWICMSLSAIGFIIIFMLYAKIIIKFAGDLRRNAIFTFIGFILIFVGAIMDSTLFFDALHIPVWLPAIFPMFGLIDLIVVQRTI